MQIFDEIKKRSVEDVMFISMDGVSGLEDGAKAIFPKVIVQRCIVHLIRNSIKYISSKDYKAFTSHVKKIYGASSLKAAQSEFEKFKQIWSQYPGAVDVWVRIFSQVEHPFDYGSSIRKNNVYDKCRGARKFKFPKSSEERRLPKRKRLTEITVSANNGTLPQMARRQSSELGYGQKPAFGQSPPSRTAT